MHPTSQCPTFLAFPDQFPEQANVMYDNNKFGNTYNPNWRNHPNLAWKPNPPQPNFGGPNNFGGQNNFGNQNQNIPGGQQSYRPPFQQPQRYNEPPRAQPSLEDTLKAFMQTTSQNLSRLETQIGQLAAQTSEREKGKFSSQTIPNPKTQCSLASSSTPNEHVHAITALQSGRQIDNNVVNPDFVQEQIEEEDAGNKEVQTKDNPPELELPEQENNNSIKEPVPEPDIAKYIPRAPFPQKLEQLKKDSQYGDILELFKHVQINIPLLDAIKQVPAYAKFLKDLVTAKKKTNVPKKAFLTEQVSALILNKYPIKYKDPGSPTITCKIGNFPVDRALLDLGASINLLPYSTYCQLGLGDLKLTTMRIQLADHSIRIARGILEDVLIKIENFYFPVDFVVIDTEPVCDTATQVRIILGRPFVATANALINCRNGVMKISFGNMTLELNIFNISRQILTENDDLCELNFIDDFVNDSLTLIDFNSFDDYMAI